MIPFLLGLVVVSIPIALAWASTWRLVRGLSAVDASAIARAVRRNGSSAIAPLADELGKVAPASLSCKLVEAVRATPADATPLARELALSEAVSDVERALVADARTPRVAASLAASAGLFAAALVMRDGLGGKLVEGEDPVPRLMAVIDRGLSLAALAVLGGVVCAALHRCGQAHRHLRLREVDELAEALEQAGNPDRR